MDEFLKRAEQAIASRELLREGDAVLVAVSGGLDSMVLLHALNSLASRHRWLLIVAHFNHRLRGRAAEADQHFVARTVEKLGLRFESASADVNAFAKAQKISVEMAARTLRHQFLARTARGLGIGKVALAHHADDQIELFLMRLLRGAGSSGLTGMHWSAKSPADSRIKLIRPMLDVRKTELAAWAREQKIAFREDSTNASTDILRNRIRHKLLPLLRREYQPGIDHVLLRESELLREESDFISIEATKAARSRKRFDALPIAVQRRMIQTGLSRAGIAADFTLIEKLRLKVDGWISVDKRTFCRRDDRGRIEKRPGEAAEFNTDELSVDLGEVRSVRFDGIALRWSRSLGSGIPVKRNGLEFFDADAVGKMIILRHWRPGDRFQPIGMKSPVKLQDVFTNQKISRERRHTLVVATTAVGEVFWVEGLRIGESFKVKASTRQRLEWKWRRV